jgi:hypothetical protein
MLKLIYLNNDYLKLRLNQCASNKVDLKSLAGCFPGCVPDFQLRWFARVFALYNTIVSRRQGRNLRGVWGGGGETPQNTNHLVWQGESSGLAGQSKILNDRM